MKYQSIFFLLVLILAQACVAQPVHPVDNYIVTVAADNIRKVHVEAQLTIPDQTISMNWPSANSVPDGWAHFIEDLKATDLQGIPISLKSTGKATWKLNTSAMRIVVHYDINIFHDSINWLEGGHSASAYMVDNVVYAIGAALFIATPKDVYTTAGTPANVLFNIPEGFKVVAPWKASKNVDNKFEVNSTYELVRTGLSFGNLEQKNMEIDGMRVTIATASDFTEVIPLFQSIYEEFVPATLNYFGDKKEENYLVIANRAPRTEKFEPYFSGEALHQSMSIISPFVPTEEHLMIFWYILGHEYIHIWNGINIQTEEIQKESWFSEGFTDYITWGLLHKLGKIPQDITINGISIAGNGSGWGENIKKYLAVAGTKSPREAGMQKEENYDLIYSGGSVFALILDIELNHSTNGKMGLRQLMVRLNQLSKEQQSPFKYTDIIDAANEISGTDLKPLFEKYIRGKEVIPISDYLEKAGLSIKNPGTPEQSIDIIPNPSTRQQMVLQKILNSP